MVQHQAAVAPPEPQVSTTNAAAIGEDHIGIGRRAYGYASNQILTIVPCAAELVAVISYRFG